MNDDPIHSPLARNVLSRLSPQKRGYINLVVLAEVTWTLARKFKAPRDEIHEIVRSLLGGENLTLEAHERVGLALDVAKANGSGFNDALIGVLNRHAGCMETMTFDRGAPSEAGFTILT
ncbi:PIN domain-containing protein [Bosea vaviloviae]|nr:PIN domain-containing protein [Bosea vaviloviae]